MTHDCLCREPVLATKNGRIVSALCAYCTGRIGARRELDDDDDELAPRRYIFGKTRGARAMRVTRAGRLHLARLQMPRWNNNHTHACCCMACVMIRTEARDADPSNRRKRASR